MYRSNPPDLHWAHGTSVQLARRAGMIGKEYFNFFILFQDCVEPYPFVIRLTNVLNAYCLKGYNDCIWENMSFVLPHFFQHLSKCPKKKKNLLSKIFLDTLNGILDIREKNFVDLSSNTEPNTSSRETIFCGY